MPDNGDDATIVSNTPTTAPVAPADVSDSQTPIPEPVNDITPLPPTNEPEDIPEVAREVAGKINEAQNILIALSSDPSVDEMAAAIGLSLFLDRLGKRATAIYSGTTPNALEFLKPEDTFESTADTLQDFVIALNKEKADHLRYKLDGDYVKIYITPYRNRISEDDLDFSYGDFNVDLVLALDVANGIDLDSALREHGRIMHDAVIINITTGNPGKLGEIEWSDKSASSVSEMVAKLLYATKGESRLEKEEATAFLTGIVAATNRFSNAKTTAETMRMSSRLMESGANQQLVSKNITPDVDNEIISMPDKLQQEQNDDPINLSIRHDNEESREEIKEEQKEEVDKEPENTLELDEIENKEELEQDRRELEQNKEDDASSTINKESSLLDDLKAAEASLSHAGAETTPESSTQPFKIDSMGESASQPAPLVPEKTPEIPEPTPTDTEPSTTQTDLISDKPEKVIQPSNDLTTEFTQEGEPNKYGQMLEDALAGINPTESTISQPSSPAPSPTEPAPAPFENPAAMNTPVAPTSPDINGVPEINYAPMPNNNDILPPPPTPPITPAMPTIEPTPEPLGPQPAMQDQVYQPQVSDPSAFKIPGM